MRHDVLNTWLFPFGKSTCQISFHLNFRFVLRKTKAQISSQQHHMKGMTFFAHAGYDLLYALEY